MMKILSRKWKYDAFCYICGTFIKVRDIKSYSKACDANEDYFNCPIQNLNNPWAPDLTCSKCKSCAESKQFLIKKYDYYTNSLFFFSFIYI